MDLKKIFYLIFILIKSAKNINVFLGHFLNERETNARVAKMFEYYDKIVEGTCVKYENR